jgi:hypothetical protein
VPSSSAATSLAPVELRPHRVRNGLLFLLIWAILTAGAVLALANGEAVLASIVVLGLLGVPGLIVMPFMFRERSVRLDAHGIAIRQPGATIELAWSDVEDVGIRGSGAWGSTIVGLRVRDPDAVAGQIAAGKGGGPVVRNRTALAWMERVSRASSGYDLGLSWIDRDRSPEKLVELIERYRAVAQRG